MRAVRRRRGLQLSAPIRVRTFQIATLMCRDFTNRLRSPLLVGMLQRPQSTVRVDKLNALPFSTFNVLHVPGYNIISDFQSKAKIVEAKFLQQTLHRVQAAKHMGHVTYCCPRFFRSTLITFKCFRREVNEKRGADFRKYLLRPPKKIAKRSCIARFLTQQMTRSSAL